MDKMTYDVLIIGGGITGLMAAAEVSKHKELSCAIISKVHPIRSQSCMAQGGINAALDHNTDDTPKHHVLDTIKGGDYLSDENAVDFFCEQAPNAVHELESLGMIFNRDKDGNIAQRSFGGGMFPRTCFSRDFTGHALLHTLYGETLRHETKVYDEYYVYDLIVEDNKCIGAIVIDMATGEATEIYSKSVILATGGAGRLFYDCTNGINTTGDGMAMAYRAGCRLKNMEFVQFHPTSYAGEGYLVTEACRGEGGYLLNSNGERFMKNYDEQRMELAPRDKVSRAIQQEIDEGRAEDGHVYLDLTHIDEQIIYSTLPQVYNFIIHSYGLDCTKEPIPVLPAAHYFMGGVKTSIDCATDIQGLFAAGECSCNGIHGANRLGGNSLMETVVFGQKAGKTAAKHASSVELVPKSHKSSVEDNINNLLKRSDGVHHSKLKEDLQKTMEKFAGINRDEKGLQQGLDMVLEIKDKYKEVNIGCSDTNYNFALYEALELRNMIDIAISLLQAALARQESRGSHYRTDYPSKNDAQFQKHTLVSRNGDDKPKISYQNLND